MGRYNTVPTVHYVGQARACQCTQHGGLSEQPLSLTQLDFPRGVEEDLGQPVSDYPWVNPAEATSPTRSVRRCPPLGCRVLRVETVDTAIAAKRQYGDCRLAECPGRAYRPQRKHPGSKHHHEKKESKE